MSRFSPSCSPPRSPGSAAFAQSPDDSCRATLGWLADTFSANDAGYPAVIERKGEAPYAEMLARLADQAKEAAHGPECHAVLLDYVAWFRRGHVGVSYTPLESPSAPAPSAPAPDATDEDLRARYAGAWALDVDVPALRARFEDPSGTPTLEGVWANGTYEIAVVRADTSGTERYLGVVLASSNPRWQPGQVKLELYPGGGPSDEPGTLWMGDHSARVLTAVERIGEGVLELRPVDTYTRTAPEVASDPAAQLYLDDRAAPGPVFRQLSPRTAYLRIPSFDASQKAAIDSVVAAHHAALASTPGLVIDIRGNGGGADASYARVLDYLYTTPIRQVSAELRSTPLNNARNQRFLADPDFPEEIKEWVRDITARLDASDAEWVPMSDDRVVVERRDTVYANPSRVVVLTDEGNGSTAEQFPPRRPAELQGQDGRGPDGRRARRVERQLRDLSRRPLRARVLALAELPRSRYGHRRRGLGARPLPRRVGPEMAVGRIRAPTAGGRMIADPTTR